MGNAVAINTALKNSTGYYIAFMDDDDEWIDKKKLEKQVKIFESFPEKFGIICTSVNRDKDIHKKVVMHPKNFKKHLLEKNGKIYSPTVLTKKTILNKLNGFDEKIKKGVDSDFYRN